MKPTDTTVLEKMITELRKDGFRERSRRLVNFAHDLNTNQLRQVQRMNWHIYRVVFDELEKRERI